MRPISLFGAACLLALLPLVGGTQPSAATVIYPWCAHYGGRLGGAPNCGFTTFAQCLATVSGTQGTCEMNPWYALPPPAPADRARRLRAQ